jgi:ATP/maltotriose-dependent transcriptional regulator MalT
VGGPVARQQGLALVREPIRRDLERRAWEPAYRALLGAQDTLEAAEQLWLAQCAYLLGLDDACLRHLEHAHQRLVDGEVAWAARAAFWIAWVLFDRGEVAKASGWLARGRRLLDDHDLDVVEAGYLTGLEGIRLLYAGDGAGAERRFREVGEDARRFDEIDLLALANLGLGEALRVQGALTQAASLLDEAMVAVVGDEVCPIIAGLVYCAVIEACEQTYDLRRAQEWTDALTSWCDAQPGLVPYRGNCQVHRVEVLRMHGSWRDAMTAAIDARRQLSDRPGPAVGAAIYQQAELHRLRGRFQLAEEGFTEASRYGHDPQPGLARLRLAQGDAAAGAAGLRRALDEGDRSARPRLLSAYVEVALGCGDDEAARIAADELAVLAARAAIPLLAALAGSAAAEVALAAGDPTTGLRAARRTWSLWEDVGAPYEAARARVLVGRACEQLGDRDAARLECDAARRAFQQLGATSDLRALDAAARRRRDGGPLSDREGEVLRLVAEGRTNRSVAAVLHLSDKTVARHLSNIYLKLGVSTRAAATAWAYEHGEVRREPEADYTG